MNISYFSEFASLHNSHTPLVLHNIWDAAGAVLMQNGQAKALATSSAAVAWSLGYADGNCLPVEELIMSVSRILRVTHLPLSIDIENGYSDDPKSVAELASRLKALGVAGINIEEGVERVDLLVDKITAIRDLVGSELFINARTDVYLHALAEGNATLAMTQERLGLYQTAGANGGFVPGLSDQETALSLVGDTNMPLNLMIMNDDEIQPLAEKGVKRFSFGPAPFIQAYSSVFATQGNQLDYGQMNGLFS